MRAWSAEAADGDEGEQSIIALVQSQQHKRRAEFIIKSHLQFAKSNKSDAGTDVKHKGPSKLPID